MTERVSRVSSHYAIAELAAFPFGSESALASGATELCPKMENPTGLLWREAERVILGSLPSLSLDEFVARRDALWFQTGPSVGDRSRQPLPVEALPLLIVLRRLARRCLAVQGSVARPRLCGGEFVGHSQYSAQHARGFWKWLRLAMPPDLLLAGLGEGIVDIETLNPALDQRLRDAGFAEIHLHYGAGLDFSDLWAAACSGLFGITQDPDAAFASPGAALDEGRDFADWLLRASIVRYFLAHFLARRSESQRFSAYLDDQRADLCKDLGLAAALALYEAVFELRRGRLPKHGDPHERRHRFFCLQQAFMALRMHWSGRYSLAEDSVDPLSDWSVFRTPQAQADERPDPPKGRARLIELDFLERAFAYLDSAPKDSERWFPECLWQSIRIRNLFYRHVTQRPLTPGLPWFLRTFARLSPAKRHLGVERKMRLAAWTSGQGRGLRSLELRTSPDPDPSEILEQVEGALALSREVDEIDEVGLVLHLIRDRKDGSEKGRPSAGQLGGQADPDNLARYGRWYLEKKEEIFAFAAVLRDFPDTLELIRGVDLCADEAGIPNWVCKPLFRYLRDVADASARVQVRPGERAISLHTTIHAGEDWLHLLGGLRRIDEARTHFEMRAGDRFGHALALGLDPMRWSQGCGPIAMPRELRLFDLAWVWGLRDRVPIDASAVEAELSRLMGEVFGPSAADAQLAEGLVEGLHDEAMLHRLRYPSFVDLPAPSSQRPSNRAITQCYLADPGCFRRSHAIIHVDPRAEGERVAAVQDWLRRELDSLGVVIEVNPSSNFLTQQLPSIQEHPIWQLHEGRHNDLPQLPVVIGSDDPITFATTLPEEYQLMHDALVLGGRTNDEADHWLDEARRNSMLHRWTRPLSRPADEFHRWISKPGLREDQDLPP